MITEEDLNGVRGWLIVYVTGRYIGAVLTTILIGLLFRTATMNADCNRSRHPLHFYAATKCKVMQPPGTTVSRH